MRITLRNTFSYLLILAMAVIAITFESCETKVEVPRYGSMEGTILDAETLEPIKGVSVSTSPASTVILTDEDGNFTIEKLEVDEYSITARKSGYKNASTSANVRENETTSLTFTMEEGDNTASDLEVTPSPAMGADTQSRNLTLSWSLSKSLANPTFDVTLYRSDSTSQNMIASNISDTFIAVEDLQFGTTYFWQIAIYENGSFVTNSETFSFNTVLFPDNEFRFSRMVNGSYEIFSSDSLEEDQTQLTFNPSSAEVYPRLNPQRDLIAFTSNRDLDFHIYTMTIEGKEQKRITSLPVAGAHNNGIGYCWSPDGGKFLYSHFDKLYTIDRNGTDRQLIATAPVGRHFRSVDWNGQTDKIIVQTIGPDIYNSEFYIMDEDGSNMQLLISNVPGRLESPSLSIKGDQVLYSWDEDGLNAADGRQLDSRIYLMSLDSTSITDLSFDKKAGTNDLYPSFSADGNRVIFVNTSNTGLGEAEIYIMGLDGQNRTKLFDMATFPDWF